MRKEMKFGMSAAEARKIGHYVYVYVDPRNRRPFYIGKGKGFRALVHLGVKGASLKASTIRHIRRAGFTPQIDILAHGLPDEQTAFRIEAAVIDAFGRQHLTNRTGGWRSKYFGRMPLRQLLTTYRAKKATVREPVVLVRISRLYRAGMSDRALYEATRGVWKLNALRAANAKYALAIFEGIVCEVYAISKWVPAGSTRYITRPLREIKIPRRLEFVGRVAPQSIRRRYVDRSVRECLKRGVQSPVLYLNC